MAILAAQDALDAFPHWHTNAAQARGRNANALKANVKPLVAPRINAKREWSQSTGLDATARLPQFVFSQMFASKVVGVDYIGSSVLESRVQRDQDPDNVHASPTSAPRMMTASLSHVRYKEKGKRR